MQIVLSNGVVAGVFSFTTGFVSRTCTMRRMSENDVQAYCLWLERHDQPEEAVNVLDRWCAGYPCYCRW